LSDEAGPGLHRPFVHSFADRDLRGQVVIRRGKQISGCSLRRRSRVTPAGQALG
jgi:hypothetical protein